MARQIIRERRVVTDHCRHLDRDTPLPDSGDITLPPERWQQERSRSPDHLGRIGIRLPTDADLASLVAAPTDIDPATIELIAIQFDSFTDGRGFSLARSLRDRYGYRGELRAMGPLLRDQLPFLARCGFDSFELTEEVDPFAALDVFQTITVHYQPASDTVTPVHRLRGKLS